MEREQLEYFYKKLLDVLVKDGPRATLKAEVKSMLMRESVATVTSLIRHASGVKLAALKAKNLLLIKYANEVNDFRPLEWLLTSSNLASSLGESRSSTRPVDEVDRDTETSEGGSLRTGKRMRATTLQAHDAWTAVLVWNDVSQVDGRCRCATRNNPQWTPFGIKRIWKDPEELRWLCTNEHDVCGKCRKWFLCGEEHEATRKQARAICEYKGVPDALDLATVDVNVRTVQDLMECSDNKVHQVWTVLIETLTYLDIVRELDSGNALVATRGIEPAHNVFAEAYATVTKGYTRLMGEFRKRMCRPIVASVCNRLFNMLTVAANRTSIGADARDARLKMLLNPDTEVIDLSEPAAAAQKKTKPKVSPEPKWRDDWSALRERRAEARGRRANQATFERHRKEVSDVTSSDVTSSDVTSSDVTSSDVTFDDNE